MSPAKVVHKDDLPPELLEEAKTGSQSEDWVEVLRQWADRQLTRGSTALLESATPQFERTMIETALRHSGGRRQDAARLLGWGRNTLTRKIKELGMEEVV